ncbi:MAG TPA: DASH family cryptochrome, partial [Flavobacteriaceae bacterium]|nr:DASH family cryptochrome [Flavobacteriaceae bacterium]
MNTAIIWYTNDLRVQDHSGLAEATRLHDRVIAYYCFDQADYAPTPWGFRKTG